MKAEDIKVGMWLRWDDDAVRVTAMLGDLVLVDAGTHGLHIVRPGCVEPWTPQVGEWVSAVRPTFHDGPFMVVSISVLAVGEPWVEVANANGSHLTARAGLFAPCLPTAVQTTTTTTWNEAGGAIVPGSVRVEAEPCGPAVMHANTTCLHCGGLAYIGLQEARCLAPKCERVEPEPEVEVGWRAPEHPEPPSDSPEWLAWCRGHERVHVASGLGHSAQHPIRDEAIRLWREAVSRG